jgi:tetratricopeptide (TPR) repeat protein
MRAVYNNLARGYAKTLNGDANGDPPAELLNAAEDFLARGCGVGMLLEDPDERWEAQNMLNFWAKILYRYNRAPGDEPPAATLSPFGIPESSRVSPATIVFQAPPDPRDVYVGRKSFIADLKQQLSNGRNIALCGPPGIGKTLIATKLAHDPELRKKYPEGVLWARVGEQPDVSNILRTWLEALQISSETDAYIDVEHVAKLIRQALALRRMLLVIDDPWHSSIGTVLKLGGSECVHILTTCLMSVALDFDVQGAVKVPGFTESDGLRLFEQQAPNAIKGQENEIEELVQTVDYSPLALALLANYCKLHPSHRAGLDLKEIRSRILEEKSVIEAERPSIFLKDACDEVRTPAALLAMIRWCFEQLRPEEKHVLQAFSFFPPKPNSFSDAAAQYVTEEHREHLTTLLDYGLLEKVPTDRYSVHRAVSDFLKRRPYPDANRAPEQRMATFFVNLVKDPDTSFSLIEQEEVNILAALDTAYHHGVWRLVVEGSLALFKYFDRRGLYALAKKNLERAREAAKKLNDESALAAVLLKLGEIEERRSEYDAAREHLTASLEIARRLGELQISAHALQLLGVVGLAQAQYVEGEANLKEALGLAQEIGDVWIECAIETNLGWMERGFGYLEQAKKRNLRALDLATANGFTGHMAELELSLGVLEFVNEDYEQAKEHDLKGLHYAEELQDKRLQCGLHQALGGVEIARGNFDKAEEHLMKSLHLSVEIGHRWYNSVIWKELGILRLKQQRPNAAASAFKRSLDLAREVRSPERVASALYGLAKAAALQGNYAEARLQGRTSLNIYESIPHHPRNEELKNWIESLSVMT